MRCLTGLINVLIAVFILLMVDATLAQSPGDTIGWMQFDNQSWASIGHKIAIDDDGGAHIVWHQSYPDTIEWNIKYAHISSSGSREYFDLGVGECPQIALNSQNQPGITFHHGDDWDMTYWTPQGRYLLPDIGMWPMVTIDRQDRVHIAYFWFGGGREGVRNIGYVRSDDSGQTWTEPVKVDSALTPSFMITSSPVSDKVAIVYSNNLTWEPVGVSYIESRDGENWDWQEGAIDVTNYPHDPFVTGDDLDAVYDYNDNLHIVWNAQACYGNNDNDSVYIRHYDSASGQTNVVAVVPPWPIDNNCIVGWWNGPLCKMSIARSIGSLLAVTYTRFDPKDCSQGGSAEGEIFMQLSRDGQTWSFPSNLTHSRTPFCASGDCNSDHWGSLAERLDGHAHLFYVNDKDAGDRYFGEGSYTINPMLYYPILIEESNIADGTAALPKEMVISYNYPNPFNAQTTILYSLAKESQIKIELFNVLGEKVKTLKEGREMAGSYAVTWDAEDYPSGIYFYCLQTEFGAQNGKMVLLK